MVMGSVRFGGDPESYMDPPQMTQTDKPGGASIIATVLDLLGIGQQVAKEPKKPKGDSQAAAPGAGPETTQSIQPAPSKLSLVNDMEQVFQPMEPLPTDWGQRYLESIKPIKRIDPNTAL